MNEKEKKPSTENVGIEEEKIKTLPREDIKENVSNPTLLSQQSQAIPRESQNTEIRDFCISRLLDGCTYVNLSEELKSYNIQISKSQLQRLLPKKLIDSIREQMKTQEQPQIEFQTPSKSVPSAHLVIPHQWLIDYESTLPTQQRRVFGQMRTNLIKYNQQLERELKQQQRGSSSNPSAYGGSGYDALCKELAESEKMERLMRLRRGFGRGASGNDGVESMLKLIKLGVDLVPKGQNVDSIGVYRSGRQDQKTDSPGKMGETNLVDLRLEELRQSHDLDMQRLSWDQKKYFLKLENDTQKWDKLQETFGPILQTASPEIRDIIRKIGENVGKSLGGLGANPNPNAQEVTSIKCPRCASPLNVKIPQGLDQIQVKCPSCENLFKIGKDQPKGSSLRTELRPKTRLGYKDS